MLLEDIGKLGFQVVVEEVRGTVINLRFPEIRAELEVAAILDFFTNREKVVGDVKQFLVSQMRLEHVFNRFAAENEESQKDPCE